MSAYRRLREEDDVDGGDDDDETNNNNNNNEDDQTQSSNTTATSDRYKYYTSRGTIQRANRPGLDLTCSVIFMVGWVAMTVSTFLVDRAEEVKYHQKVSTSVYLSVLALLGSRSSSVSLDDNNTSSTTTTLDPDACFDGGITAMRSWILTVCLANLCTYLFKLTVFFQFVCASVKEYAAMHSGGVVLADCKEDTVEHLQRARWVATVLVRIALFPMAFAHLLAAIALQQTRPYMRAYSESYANPSERRYCFRLYLLFILVLGQALVSIFAGLLAFIKTVGGHSKSTRSQVRKRLENQNVTRILSELV
uniref:Membrane protein ORF82 n=1 Tax=Cyprinid herpesvirus 2 TaxID=317878 RepID=A0A6H0QZP8_CYHV2